MEDCMEEKLTKQYAYIHNNMSLVDSNSAPLDNTIVSDLVLVATALAHSTDSVVVVMGWILVKRTLCWWRIWSAVLFLTCVHEMVGAMYFRTKYSHPSTSFILVWAMAQAAQLRLLEMVLGWICRFLGSIFVTLAPSEWSEKPCHRQTASTGPPDSVQFAKPMVWYTKPTESSNDCDIWKVTVSAERGCRDYMPSPCLLAPQKTTTIKAKEWFDKSTGNDARHIFSRPNL